MIPWKNIPRFLHKALKNPGYALKVFMRRLGASFYYRLGRPISCAPESVTMFLTWRCNLRCKMCGQWGDLRSTAKNSSTGEAELSLDEAKNIVDGLAVFKPNITLFGGEPLLYPHCAQLIQYIKQKKMHCLIITNATLLKERAEQLIEAGLDELNVSIDGAGALHDEIRGQPHLFEDIIAGLTLIQRLKKEKRKNRPLINIQCTISRHNYLRLEELLEVAKSIEANSLTFHNLIFLEKEALLKQKEADILLGSGSQGWEGFACESGIDAQLLYDKMHKILSARYPFSVDFYPNFSREELIAYYGGQGCSPKEYACRCLSPWIAGYIFPDGEIRPCLNFTYAFGNVKEGKFLDIWNGANAVKFRKLLKEKKSFPACVRCTELFRY